MQLGKWDVDVNGQTYAVTIDRAENGKDMVRINGRVAAKPIGAEENSRPITVAGWPYTLKRINANTYDLEANEVSADAARARTLETANTVLAHANAPVSLQRDSFFTHLPKFGYLFVVLGVVGLMYMLKSPSYDKVAFQRVNRVLSEMHSEKSSQFAVTFWAKNKKILDTGEMSIASDNFDRWRRAKDLYRQVGDYHVIESKMVDDEKTPTAIVRFVLEGKEYRVRVPQDRPITWED